MSQKPEPSTPDNAQLSRRRLFAGAGGVGALAAAAAVLPMSPPEQPAAVVGAAGGGDSSDSSDGRYQLTEHVKRYYQTARV